jgi:hypothetical protein
MNCQSSMGTAGTQKRIQEQTESRLIPGIILYTEVHNILRHSLLLNTKIETQKRIILRAGLHVFFILWEKLRLRVCKNRLPARTFGASKEEDGKSYALMRSCT